jgi:general secretion pathway protein H
VGDLEDPMMDTRATPTRVAPAPRGFTLIELMVSIALAAVMTAIVIVTVGQVEFARLTTDASRVAGAVRYLQNLAVMNNAYYRLVIDLSNGRYVGEEIQLADSHCAVFKRVDDEDEEGAGGGAPSDGPPGGGVALGEASPPRERPSEGAGEAQAPEPPPVGLGGASGGAAGMGAGVGGKRQKLRKKANLLKRMELGRGVRFTGLLTEYRQDLRTEGRGSILFFPDGTIEKALVYLAKEDETYTVMTYPAMGMARVFPEELDQRRLEAAEGD